MPHEPAPAFSTNEHVLDCAGKAASDLSTIPSSEALAKAEALADVRATTALSGVRRGIALQRFNASTLQRFFQFGIKWY
jgi:hypothetical protein